MNDQSTELRSYLEEAEALAREWYSRAGLEETHERNIETLATLMGLHWVMEGSKTFGELTDVAMIYLVAAFQMGRAGADDHNSCVAE